MKGVERSLTLLCILAVLIAARWLWVAGIGDYGWTYEVAYRISVGEVQHRDFITCLPALTHYTLAALVALVDESLWMWAVHLYAWWFATLLVGWLLLQRLTSDERLQQAGVILLVVSSNPAGTLGHAHNYASAAFAGLGALFILRALQEARQREWFRAGVAIGLATLAKQNVGCMAAVAGSGVLLLQGLREGQPRKAISRLCWFVLGIAMVFVPAAVYFGVQVGLVEFVRQEFTDATAAKGGIAMVLGRALPRIVLRPETPHRRLVEALLSAALLLLLSRWLWLKLRNVTPRPAGNNVEISPRRPWSFPIQGLLFGTVVLSAVSLLPWPWIRASLPIGVFRFVPTGTEVFIQMAYLFSVTAFAVVGFRCSDQLKWVAVSVLGGAILLGAATSSILYYPFVAPVVIPMLLGLLQASASFPNLARHVLIVSFLFLAVFFFRPSLAPTFEALKPLPRGSPFAGLYAPADTSELIESRWQGLTPWIRGRRTLWLCSGGPHSAYGGLPVKNVPFLYKDTYHSRHEQSLRRAWDADPPEFVIVGPFLPASEARLLTAEAIQDWLVEHFEPVWRALGEDLSLWRRKLW